MCTDFPHTVTTSPTKPEVLCDGNFNDSKNQMVTSSSTSPSSTFFSTTYIDYDDFSLAPITGTSYQPGDPPSANFTINSTAEGGTTFQLQIHGETMISRIYPTTPVIIQRTVNVTITAGMSCAWN